MLQNGAKWFNSLETNSSPCTQLTWGTWLIRSDIRLGSWDESEQSWLEPELELKNCQLGSIRVLFHLKIGPKRAQIRWSREMDHQVTTIWSPVWSARHRSQSQHRAESSGQVEYHDSLGMVKLPGGCKRGKTSVSLNSWHQPEIYISLHFSVHQYFYKYFFFSIISLWATLLSYNPPYFHHP